MLEARLVEGGCGYRSIPGMDPRAGWLLGHGMADFMPAGEDTLIPCLMLLDPGTDFPGIENAFFRTAVRAPRRSGNEDQPELVLGFATKAFFDDLDERAGPLEELKASIRSVVLSSPISADARAYADGGETPTVLPDQPDITPPPCGWPPGTVVIGLIDDGIAFANRRFRRADGETRVEAFWQQGPPDIVGEGLELIKRQIDQLLVQHSQSGWLDEAELYRAAGLVDFGKPGHKAAAWRAAHGTHVLDLAAALESGVDERSRPIIAVELPTAAVADTSFRLLAEQVLAGIEYIFNRAALLTPSGADPLPVVICLSYGMYAGPHDGTHPVELAFDQLIADDPERRAIVLPSGNSHLERCHASIVFPAPPEVEVALPWRVLPDDRTPSSVEVWLPYAGNPGQPPSRVRLALVPPHGLAGNAPPVWLGEDQTAKLEIVDTAGRVLAAACYTFVEGLTQRGVFTIELQPTARLAPFDPTLAEAPAGVWTIRLARQNLPADARLEAWIQRDDAPYGYPIRGRQSYFDAPRYVRYDFRGEPVDEDDHDEQVAAGDVPIRRDAQLNAIASGDHVLVAGSWQRRENRVAPYSAGGPVTPRAGETLDATRRKPDALAMSDDSRALRGVLAAGTASGSVVAFTGTSIAAPQLAREVANRLAANLQSDRDSLRDDVLDGNQPPPRERQGWGLIEVPPVVSVPR
jgi:hypothetical protein